MIEKANRLEVTCPYSSSPCQTCEQSHQFVNLPQDEKNQSLQRAKIVEIDNKSNLVNHAKTPKVVKLDGESDLFQKKVTS